MSQRRIIWKMNHRVTKDTVTDTCSTLEQYSRTGAILTLYVTVVLSCCESHRLPLTGTHLVSCVLTVCHLQTATNAVPWAHQPLYKPVVCGAMLVSVCGCLSIPAAVGPEIWLSSSLQKSIVQPASHRPFEKKIYSPLPPVPPSIPSVAAL